MSERTSAPAKDPFTPETMHEAQKLIALLRRLGVTTSLSNLDGNPTFVFSQGEGIDDGGLVALMVENRSRAEPDFREALKSVLSEPTEAEQACGSLETMGFLTAVAWSDGPKPTPALLFEPSGLDVMKPEALAEIEAVRRRFHESSIFADEMIVYLVNLGAAFEPLRMQPVRNVAVAEERARSIRQLGDDARARDAHADALEAEGVIVSSSAKADKLSDFDPDPAMDAAIEAKIGAVLNAGVGQTVSGLPDDAACRAVLDVIELTDEEREYVARQGLVTAIRVEVGRKVVETLNAGNMRIGREDLFSSLTAYFEAVDAGEVEAAA